MPQREDDGSQLTDLYKTLADVARDQVNSQINHADTLDLKAIGVLGAIVAVVVASFAVRSVTIRPLGWWWAPLLAFVPSVLALVLPLRGPGGDGRRTFVEGPRVPDFLRSLREVAEAGEIVTLESSLTLLLQLLEASWRTNDALLKAEVRQFRFGLMSFGIASVLVLGLYAWQLT